MNILVTKYEQMRQKKKKREKKIKEFNVQILASSVEDVYVCDVDDAKNESNHHPLKQ